jgi:hypothetical protein
MFYFMDMFLKKLLIKINLNKHHVLHLLNTSQHKFKFLYLKLHHPFNN